MKLTLCNPPDRADELQWARGTDDRWYAKAADGTWHRYEPNVSNADGYEWSYEGGTGQTNGLMRLSGMCLLDPDDIGGRRAYWWRKLFPALEAA